MGLSKTAKTMCLTLLCLFALFLAVGIAISLLLYPFEPPLRFAAGLAAGTVLSLVKVILLEKALNHAADLGETGTAANGYSVLQAMLRHILTVAVLLLVVFFPGVFGLWGTIVGLLSLQLTSYIVGYILRKDGTPV